MCLGLGSFVCVYDWVYLYLDAFEARLAEPMQISNISFLVPAITWRERCQIHI